MERSNRSSVLKLLIALAVLALEGCATATGPVSYPAAWAPIEPATTGDGCPALEGTYSNHGSATFPVESGEPPALSQVFRWMGQRKGSFTPIPAGEEWPVLPDAGAVSIVQTPELFVITFLNNKGDQTSLKFRRLHFDWHEKRYDQTYYCNDSPGEPRLQFLAKPEQSRLGSGLYAGGEDVIVFLLKAADGSLVVQWRRESVGISLFVVGTHYTFNSTWWRYPLLESAQ